MTNNLRLPVKIFLPLLLILHTAHAAPDTSVVNDFILKNSSLITQDQPAGKTQPQEMFYDSTMIGAYKEQYLFSVKHQMNVYKFQYYTSMIIFLMVLGIVACGLYLSFRQFKLHESTVKDAMNRKGKNRGTPAEAEMPESSLEVSRDGIKINTAVIGLMILALSLGFFFLYLNFVYKIESGPAEITIPAAETSKVSE